VRVDEELGEYALATWVLDLMNATQVMSGVATILQLHSEELDERTREHMLDLMVQKAEVLMALVQLPLVMQRGAGEA
jgi:hypothetical protein